MSLAKRCAAESSVLEEETDEGRKEHEESDSSLVGLRRFLDLLLWGRRRARAVRAPRLPRSIAGLEWCSERLRFFERKGCDSCLGCSVDFPRCFERGEVDFRLVILGAKVQRIPGDVPPEPFPRPP